MSWTTGDCRIDPIDDHGHRCDFGVEGLRTAYLAPGSALARLAAAETAEGRR